MELVYLKNISSNNLTNIDFYLSNDYKFTFDDTKFKCELSKNYNLFDGNLKITAIVGENGSGKSSLLNHIYKFSQMNYYDGEESNENTHSGVDFLIYKNKDGELNIKGDIYGLYDYSFNYNNEALNCSLIDFDNSIKNNYPYDEKNNIYKLIKVLSRKNNILKYFNEKFIFKKIQLKLNRDKIEYFDENRYPNSKLFSNLKNRIIYLIKKNVESIKYESTFDRLNTKLMFSTKNIELEIKISYLIKYLYDLQERFISQENINEDFLNKQEGHFNNLIFENMFDLIKDFDNKINSSNIFYSNLEKEIIAIEKLISIFKQQFIDYPKNFTMKSHLFIDKNNIIDYETSCILHIEEDSKIIKEIFDIFEESLKFSPFYELFSFELYSYNNNVIFSELSSGEQNLINKYILILHEIFFNNSDIILLDEPDILLHPNWAKKFIKKIIDIITNDSILKEKKLHIIMSTHSPFLLSDIPKENVIFLKDGKQVYPDINTFGANIHTLLSHGFFMEDGLMGEFAKSKINEVIEILKDKRKKSKKNLEYCENIISLIGEPILKSTLENMLEEKKYQNESKLEKLKRKQKELNKEIKKLESKSNEEN